QEPLMKHGTAWACPPGKGEDLASRQDGLGIAADIGLPQKREPFSAVVIFHEVPRQRIDHDGHVRMAVRRSRMLGNGGQEAFLIDGCLLQMPMDKEEIIAYVNVLEGDVADIEI